MKFVTIVKAHSHRTKKNEFECELSVEWFFLMWYFLVNGNQILLFEWNREWFSFETSLVPWCVTSLRRRVNKLSSGSIDVETQTRLFLCTYLNDEMFSMLFIFNDTNSFSVVKWRYELECIFVILFKRASVAKSRHRHW